MARLDALIRHRKWELDLKRRELAALEEERDAIIAQMDGLLAEYQSEAGKTQGDVSIVTMGAYTSGVKVRREAMEEQLEAKDAEIAEQREILTEAFQELKTFEIAHEKRLAEEAKEEAKKEQNALDEQGMQSYARNEDG